MATGVAFGSPNSVLYQPGAYTQVDASALELAQAFSRNTVCILGQALGGEPMRVYAFNSAAQAQQVFGAGTPLGDAITFAFRGGVNGGAPVVLGVRVDNAAQASGVLNAVNGTGLKGVFKDYGGYGNTYSISFAKGSTVGTMAVIEGKYLNGTDYYQKIDNVPSFSDLVRRISAESPIEVEVTAGGTKASQTLTIATSQDNGRAQLNDEIDDIITTEGYLYQFPQALYQDSLESFAAAFNATISWAATVASNTITATGAGLSNDTPVYIRGDATGNLDPDTIYYVVSAVGDAFSVAVTSGGTAIALTGTFTNVRVIRALGSTTVSSSLPAIFEGTYPASDVRDGYTQSVTGALITKTAYGSDIYRIVLQGADVWGHDNKEGLIGSIFTIAAGDYVGTYQITHQEWDGTGLDQTRCVKRVDSLDGLDEGSYTGDLVFWPVALLPKTQPATEALETQLPANGVLARGGQFITVTLEDPSNTQGAIAVFYATQPGDTIEGVGNKIISLIAESSEWQGVAVASAVYNAGTYTSTISIIADDPGLLGNDYKVNILVNVNTTLLVASGGTTLEGGIDPEPPKDALGNITGAIILQSGFDSVPILQRWLDGLEAVRYQPLRYLVPAGTDNIGVHAAFADHVREMSSTPKRRERICILGHGLGWTKAEVQARAETFNSERVVFASPGLQMPDNVTGILRMFSSSWASAAIVAGMLAAEGNGVSDPITHTFFTNVSATEIDYQPGSLELDDMIKSGVLTIEKEPTLVRDSRGYRVTRAITTQRSSNVFESISVINQSDFIAQAVRDMEETLFIGRALIPTTLGLIRTQINLLLQRYSNEGIIYGFDPGATVATLNRDNRNAVDVTYTIYPAPALEFILNSQLLFPIPDEG
ncbi:MAG: hypothetical protein F6K42_07990 [Leptolyngbya sp. SIO1D8]|nr:hypothetical protein [Leptolyngbya sp. SIO1D8]